MAGIGVVLVTYNRLEKLKIALRSYAAQTRQPDYIIVIDNCSTDGTAEFLRAWRETESEGAESESTEAGFRRIVRRLPENTGGSGGFYEGLRLAQQMEAEWIFVADDDAYPEPDALQMLGEYADSCSAAALCTEVLVGGKTDTWHRRRLTKRHGILYEALISAEEYGSRKAFSLDIFSYVGSMIRKEALLKAGLPNPDFFIGYDDSEHSIRLRKTGRILCVPAAKVIHDSPDAEGDVWNWKKYYIIRNKLYSVRKHFGTEQALALAAYYLLKFRQTTEMRRMMRLAVKHAFQGRLGKTLQPGG